MRKLALALAMGALAYFWANLAYAEPKKSQTSFTTSLDSLVDQESQNTDYSAGYSEKTYKIWVQNGIHASREGNAVLMVDKLANEMYLYSRGKRVKTYRIELGRNPIDDKNKEGDGRTPEGLYSISSVNFDSPKYYKSLKLDYPNSYNKKRFKHLRKLGRVSRNDSIGGDIKIHGGGIADNEVLVDWTDGCIAMSNPDIDDLFRRINPQSNQRTIRVVIVKYIPK